MGRFTVTATNLRWIDGARDDPDDLCLHGDAVASIGSHRLEYTDATVSATAFYLLKSLTEDHIAGQDNQMLPCCGHFIVPAVEGSWERVVICGCPNGIDWTVRHGGDTVILEFDDENRQPVREEVPFADYQAEVFPFCRSDRSLLSILFPQKSAGKFL